MPTARRKPSITATSLGLGAVLQPRSLPVRMELPARRAAPARRPVRLAHVTTVPMTLMFLKGQARFMRAHGIETHAFSSPGEELSAFGREEGVPVHEVSMTRRISPFRDLVSLFRLWWAFMQLRPSIVDAHTPKGGLLGLIAALLARVPVRVYHVHGLVHVTSTGLRRALLTTTERISCLCATRVLCVSPSIAGVLRDDGLCPARKIGVVEHGSINGIDTVRFDVPAEPERRAARTALGIPPDAPVVGFVGRLVCDKGVRELAAAWSRLREAFPQLHLLVLGPVEDQRLVGLLARLREDGRVHCFGWDRETPRYYRAMDVVALPSYREGFGLAALEASAMGLPVVATCIPGCVDAVACDRTGMLVPPRDAPALAEALTRYLRDPELRHAHGEAGRVRAVTEFAQKRIWDGLEKEYERACASVKRARMPVLAAEVVEERR